MQIQNAIALVTGANRGIGRAFVEALHTAGAQKNYATARNVDSLAEVVTIDPARIVPMTLDVTNADQIAEIAQQAQDINLLINNAGVLGGGDLFIDSSIETAQWEMNVTYFGTLAMTRAFAPILKRNGGGALVNLCSLASYVNVPSVATYSAAKAALHSLTQATRAQLAAQDTLVVGLYPGPIETRMAEELPLDKAPTSQVADALLQGIENGVEDIYPDDTAAQVLSGVTEGLKAIEKQFADMLP
ncbi:MAG: SDR family oxidoreductase [Leptolyngbya sp. SIO1D8]|nr:SDR family oxidoreductase [Leptolyngbya sp. SIO1D8]